MRQKLFSKRISFVTTLALGSVVLLRIKITHIKKRFMHDEYETEGFLLNGNELEGDDEETLEEAEAEEGAELEDDEEPTEIPAFEEEEE